MSASRLVLIDGMAVIYRAFYAIKELSTADGRPTNAVYGFVKMLRQILETWQPTHWCVVFDGGLPEERMTLLPEYKAQRSPMPDPLREQIGACRSYLEKARIASLVVEGEEADDLLGAIARWAEGEGAEVLIASNDKDLFQLVNDKICLIPVSGTGRSLMSAGEVREKTGVDPEQIVDWLALVGDSADNIPGVPGVGTKTAAKLLNEYGSVAGIYENLEKYPEGKIKASLQSHKSTVDRNIEMVRLRAGLACPVSMNELERREGDPKELLAFFEELEFMSMASELRQADLF